MSLVNNTSQSSLHNFPTEIRVEFVIPLNVYACMALSNNFDDIGRKPSSELVVMDEYGKLTAGPFFILDLCFKM